MLKKYYIGGRFGETLPYTVQVISFIPKEYWLLSVTDTRTNDNVQTYVLPS